MKKTLVFIIAVVLASLIISLVVGEFIVRGVSPQITYKQARAVGLRIFENSKIVPISLQANVESNHLGYTREFDHEVRINNLGFRGEDIGLEKSENTFRILVLGDSMTFGWGVEDNQTFPARLQDYLSALNLDKKIEVINAGFAAGYSLDSYYAFLIDQGINLDPDLIIVAFFPYNDISELLEMEWVKTDDKGYPLAVKSLDRTIKDGYQTFRATTELKYAIPGLRNSHLAMLLFQALERNSPKINQAVKKLANVEPPPNRTTIEETAKCIYEQLCHEKFKKPMEQIRLLFSGFNHAAENAESKLLVLLLPSPDQVEKVFKNLPTQKIISDEDFAKEEPQKEIKSYLDSIGVSHQDLLSRLANKNFKVYYYQRDGHLTPKGTNVVALDMAEMIAVNKPELLDNLTKDIETSDITRTFKDFFTATDL